MTLKVRGAGEAEPGVNLNDRIPQPSIVCPVELHGVDQSELVSAGVIRQNVEPPQEGLRSRFEKP